MCLVVIARTRIHGRSRLLLAANRDEFHRRPALPLHWWRDAPMLAGGRDARAGGTWLAVHRRGCFAAILNAAGPAPPAAPSRGELVTRFLQQPQFDAPAMQACAQDYAGFHCLAGDIGELHYVSRDQRQARHLDGSMHACGNAGIDQPGPRVERIRAVMEACMHDAEPIPALLAGLADESIPEAGPGDCRPVFIRDREFGTRCSSVICIDGGSAGRFRERVFGVDGQEQGDRTLHWRVGPAP